MNYGMYMATSGALTSMYRMDVLANNLANVNTPGFKPDIPAVRQRDAAGAEEAGAMLPSNKLLERLGAGVQLSPNRVWFEQGPLQSTGQPLDLALRGNGFFTVRDTTDTSGDRLRFTRDGAMARGADGRLVQAGTGMPVLGDNNQPIVIPEGAPVTISPDGILRQGQNQIGRIAVVDFPDRTKLTKTGNGLFRASSDALQNRRPAGGEVRQGMLEGAAVDPVLTMMRLTDAARDAERDFSTIQQHDRLMDRVINGLGRVV